jgi:hypothetical protein
METKSKSKDEKHPNPARDQTTRKKETEPWFPQTLMQTSFKTRRFRLFHKLRRADSFHERIGAFLSGRLIDFFIFENRGYIPTKIGSSNVLRTSPV